MNYNISGFRRRDIYIYIYKNLGGRHCSMDGQGDVRDLKLRITIGTYGGIYICKNLGGGGTVDGSGHLQNTKRRMQSGLG